MDRRAARFCVVIAAGIVGFTVTAGGLAQEPSQGGVYQPPVLASLPVVDRATSRDWPLINVDLANSRYSALDQINVSNIGSLAVTWLFQTRNSAAPPIVVDGVMYVTSTASVTALDAATGRTIWVNSNAHSNRGAAYGDGRIFVADNADVMALDARTGRLVDTFGDQGVSHALTELLRVRHPGLAKPTEWGYSFKMAPQYYKGIVIVGTASSEQHIPSGVVLALEATTGKRLWTFFGVPQAPGDEGWEIARNTWVGGVRHGGGIWATPAIDADTDTVHVTIANPSPDQDGSARKGINLFTNCFVALDVRTGRLKWYYQQVHHDLWDYDAGQQPALFDIDVRGRRVKAIAAGNKNGFLYILDRETGQPVNPIVETPVPTSTDVPGEEVWRTQPFPHTASGAVMEPAASQTVGTVLERFSSIPRVPFYTPPTLAGALHAPREGIHYGGSSFNPRTRLLYVAGKNLPILLSVVPVGASLKPGQHSTGGRRDSAAAETGTISAYDPATGTVAWRTSIPGGPSAGTLTTGGKVVFAGDRQGMFYALDATSGALAWTFNTGGGITGGQITYQVNGVQYVAVPSGGNVILTFALLRR